MENEYNPKPQRGEVLVAIVPRPLDLSYAREHLWYRIPVESVEKRLKKRWPPKWLAFYQTKIFGTEAFAINYFAEIVKTTIVARFELFPDEPRNEKATRRYYKLELSSMLQLPRPILSRRLRRIVFIQTTCEKFSNAVEINDLYDESPLEDKLWAAMKRLGITAERQEYLKLGKNNYVLDFAIYCAKGNIDVETDGDYWHDSPDQVKADKKRSNELTVNGWQTLRFTTRDIHEKLESYCIEKIVEGVDKYGGLEEPGKFMPRKVGTDFVYQPALFEPRSPYLIEEGQADSDSLWREIGDIGENQIGGENP